MKIYIKNQYEFLFVYFVISVFLINEGFRMVLFKFSGLDVESRFYLINIIALATVLFILCKAIFEHNIDLKLINIIGLLSVIIFLNYLNGSFTFLDILLIITTYLVPLLMFVVKFDKGEVCNILRTFLPIFNIIVFLILIVGIIDFIMSSKLTYLLADNYVSSGWRQMIYLETVNRFRLFSLWGAPLQNAFLFLAYFYFNWLKAYYIDRKKYNILVSIISFLGILLTSSRAAVICIILLHVILFYRSKNKIAFIIVGTMIGWSIVQTSIFQDVFLSRFISTLSRSDITSGRNELINALIIGRYNLPQLFWGYGANYSRELAVLINVGAPNFEYPIVMMSYDYGILFTFFVYYLLFVRTIFFAIKKKKYEIAYSLFIITMYLNIFNSFADFNDYTGRTVAIFCLSYTIIKNQDNTLTRK